MISAKIFGDCDVRLARLRVTMSYSLLKYKRLQLLSSMPCCALFFYFYKNLLSVAGTLCMFQGAWLVLSEIVAFLPKFDTSFILQYWQNGIICSGMAQSSLLYCCAMYSSYCIVGGVFSLKLLSTHCAILVESFDVCGSMSCYYNPI